MRKYILILIDFVLLFIFYKAFSKVLYYYPIPQLTWDSSYYIDTAITNEYGIRPSGYSFFLNWVYDFSKDIRAVAWAQFIVYYLSAITFLKAISTIFKIPVWLYVIVGLFLVLEPVALYHINNILSDSLFASLTLLAVAFLLLAVHKKNYIFLALHIVTIFLCIEVRHIALFYPFFTCVVIFFSQFRNIAKLAAIILVLFTFKSLKDIHVDYNQKKYGVPVYSAFSGWTHANNSLYALQRIHLDAKYIDNPDIRNMHAFFSTYLDTTKAFVVTQVGSGFLWDDLSPLNIMRNKLIDSTHINYNNSWYRLAPYYHYYGMYIQKNYPYEYIMSFMYPNIKTMLHPHHGEMKEYHMTQYISPKAMEHYGLKEEDRVCRQDIYPINVNPKLEYWYSKLLNLTAAFSLLFAIYLRRKFTKEENILIGSMIFFLFTFFGLTLYSSWFMYRYLLPVFPLMFALTVAICWKCYAYRAEVFNLEWFKK